MSRSLFDRRFRPFATSKNRHRRGASRARALGWDLLEPRTLLSTWYVNSSANGTDSGSQADPFWTIKTALNKAGAGDTILVETGDGYTENDTLPTSLTNLTIEAYPGASPVLSSGIPGSSPSPGTGFTVDATGVTISGFTIEYFVTGVDLQSSASATLSDDTIEQNGATGDLGQGGSAAGIDNAGTLTITDSTIDGNAAAVGAGIYNAGTLTITDSTISNNESLNASTGKGAGIYNAGTLAIANTTVAQNQGDSINGSSGAGIYNAGALSAVNSTIALNFAGGLYDLSAGTATLDNTIVADNVDDGGGSDDISGAAVSTASAYNLIGTAVGSGLTNGEMGNQVVGHGIDPFLGSLLNYTGPTDTLALEANSTAINGGDNALAIDPTTGLLLTTDQRGQPRFAGAVVDIGAYQYSSFVNPEVYEVDLAGTGDTGSAGFGTLAYVINQANSSFGPVEIEFASNITNLTAPSGLVLSNIYGLPIEIVGPGASALTIDGSGGPVFQVAAGETAAISGLTISGGIGVGSGISNAGDLEVTNCTITASGNGGAGGGILNDGDLAALTVIDSTISNDSDPEGGGIANEQGTTTVIGTTIEDNSSSSSSSVTVGAGIFNNPAGSLTVSGGTITGNTGGDDCWGAGIYNDGTATLLGVSLTNNKAEGDSLGGGVYNDGSLAVNGATIQINSADSGGGIYNAADGIGTITNSTIADNSGVSGGGIGDAGLTLTVVNTTIVGNNVSGGRGSGGGLEVSSTFDEATLYNTIVAQNTDGTGSGAPADDVAGNVSSSRANNLLGTGGSGGLINLSNDNLVGVANPVLGALAGNGTIPLLANSPAIDGGSVALAVNPNTGQPLTLDQRGAGFSRTLGGLVDIGAFEDQPVPSPTTVYVDYQWAGLAPGTPVMGSYGSFLHVGYDAFSSIQSAVNAVASDGTVDVAAGSYAGLITITGIVNIVGAGESATTIMGSDSGDGIDVSGGSLTASGLTIDDFSVGLLVENHGYDNVSSSVITGDTTGYEAMTGGSGEFNGINFDGANQTDVLIASGAGTVTIGTSAPNAFAASGTYIADLSSQFINASQNTFGGVNPATATTGQIDAIESGITDATDSSSAGLVEIVPGQVFITPSAEAAAPGAIGRVAAAAPAGTTINIAPGTYAGGVDVTSDQTIVGAGPSATTVSDAGSEFSVAAGVTASISGLTITGGTAASGGGIDNAGMLTLSTDTISGNMATGSGGGIENQAGGTLIISDSTISGDTAGGSGGGIDNAGMLTLTNTTIADNSAASGGGISDEGMLTAVNVTIADGNTSVGSGSGGGLDVTGAGTGTLYNTIVAQNTDSVGADDIAGNGITSASSNNLVGADESGTAPGSNLLEGANPFLGSLAYNGGPTETIALEANSPAIDAGSNSWADTYGVTTDQRGAVRGGQPDAVNAGSTVDIGAYEASSSYLVTTTADSDAIGTLRSAILWADASSNANPTNLAALAPAPNTIDFDIPTTDPGYDSTAITWTIAPTSPLPPISALTTIDGFSQPSPFSPYSYGIMLDGASAGPDSDGLDLTANGTSVLSISIDDFSGDGLKIESSDNTVQDVYLGVDPAFNAALPDGVGMVITGADNLIGTNGQDGTFLDGLDGNTMAGNLGPGIWLSGPGATDNVIAGNFMCCFPNGQAGVLIDGGASDNWIGVNTVYGAESADDANYIANNEGAGIEISGANTTTNVVAGNTIESNGTDGVLIDNGASGNWVGVNSVHGSENALQLNVISGNTDDGVEITGMDTTGNVVAGDYIGTDVTGTIAVPNSAGVEIDGGASGNLIGSNGDGVDDLLERNIISGNLLTGVWITGGGTEHNVVAGNFIGTTVTGNIALGNGSTYVGVGDDDINGGVLIDGGATDNLIGTSGHDADDAGERNVISGNVSTGIVLSGTSGNVVAGNYLGTTASGEGALGNGTYGDGVDIVNGSSGNWIGVNSAAGPGTESADQGNLISGTNPNDGWGVSIDATSSDNVIAGNLMGTDASGKNSLRNSTGIWINGPSNLVGTTGQDGADDAIERNVISGNTQFGVVITGTSATGNVIAGNYIGTTADGDASLANQYDGVAITAGADNNWIGVNPVSGGPGNADQRNVISGNQDEGISIQASTGNVVAGDYIGTNAAGNAALANGIDGVDIRAGASNNTIGGVAAAPGTGAGNLISGNTNDGVEISATGTTGDVVAGNLIGTDVTGTVAIANYSGVEIDSGASGNLIGASGTSSVTDPLERNIISGNIFAGVWMTGTGTDNNVVAGDYIGTDVTGTIAIGNGNGSAYQVISHSMGWEYVLYGDVEIYDGASNNLIGTTGQSADDAGQRNIIAGSSAGGDGVDVWAANGTVVAGNYIGTNPAGNAAIVNVDGDGIFFADVSSGWAGVNSVYGAEDADQDNVVSGNFGGVQIFNSSGVVVAGNLIGTDASGQAAIPNTNFGVMISDSSYSNLVGTTGQDGADDALERNVISGNDGPGVILGTIYLGGVLTGPVTGNVVAGNYIGTNAAGTLALGNTTGIEIISDSNGQTGVEIPVSAAGNTIGGLAATPGTGAGNLISGNTGNGVEITGGGTTGNVVAGNLIGTNASGLAAIGNSSNGVSISSNDNWVGVNPASGPESALERNVISGNGSDGVEFSSANADTVAGNFIGTDVTGNSALENGAFGIQVLVTTDDVVGLPGAGNLVSATNFNSPIDVAYSNGTVVQGNDVGTTADGMAVLPGQLVFAGIEVVDAPGTLIGGTAPGTGNLVSTGPSTSAYPTDQSIPGFPFPAAGIVIGAYQSTTRACAGTVVEGNLIGTNATGTLALGNPTYGIALGNVSDITIGGTTAAATNVIAGNSAGGIVIVGAADPAFGGPSNTDYGSSDNLIEGNLIGINFDSHGNPIAGLGNGGTFIPNGYAANEAGIYIYDPADPNQTSTDNTIGGLAAGAGNIIANNVGPGVAVVGANAFDNPILGNSIYGNSGLGIDLGDDGVTPQHTSPTTGVLVGEPNGDQNAPVFASAIFVPDTSGSNGTLTITGSGAGDPNSTYIVQFFANSTEDPFGYGQGQTLIGTYPIGVNGSGTVSGSLSFSTPNVEGDFI